MGIVRVSLRVSASSTRKERVSRVGDHDLAVGLPPGRGRGSPPMAVLLYGSWTLPLRRISPLITSST